VWPAKSNRAKSIEKAMSAEACEQCLDEEGMAGGFECMIMSTTEDATARYEVKAVCKSFDQRLS